MRVRATGGPPATVDADVLAVPIYREDAEMTGDLAELDAASGGAIRRAIEWGEFNPARASAGADRRRRPDGPLAAAPQCRLPRARRLARAPARVGRDASAEWPRRILACPLAAGRRGRRRVGGRCRGSRGRHVPSDRRVWPRARHGRHEALGRRGALHRCRFAGGARPRRRDRGGHGIRSGSGQPIGERPVSGADGRGGPGADRRWLHGRGARARADGRAGDGPAARRRAGRRASAAPHRNQAAGLGARRLAAIGSRSWARASASTRAASASSRPRGWAT